MEFLLFLFFSFSVLASNLLLYSITLSFFLHYIHQSLHVCFNSAVLSILAAPLF